MQTGDRVDAGAVVRIAHALGRPRPMSTSFVDWPEAAAPDGTQIGHGARVETARRIGRIERQADGGSAEDIARLARLRVVQHRWDDALHAFGRAGRLRSEDPVLRNDRAAVEIEVGLLRDDAWTVLRGIERLRRLLEGHPDLAVARSNLRYGLEQIGLYELASALGEPSRAPGTRAPDRRPAGGDSGDDPIALYDDFLLALPVALEAPDPSNATQDGGAHRLAAQLERLHEALPAQILRDAEQRGNVELEIIRRAAGELASFRQRPARGRCAKSDALEPARQAILDLGLESFVGAPHPLVQELDLARVGCLLLHAPRRALDELADLRALLPAASHRFNLARVDALEALALHSSGDLQAAFDAYERSAASAERSGSTAMYVRQLSSWADVALRLGLVRQAWTAQVPALRAAEGPELRDVVLLNAQALLFRIGFAELSTEVLRHLPRDPGDVDAQVSHGLFLAQRLLDSRRGAEFVDVLERVGVLLSRDPQARPSYRAWHATLAAERHLSADLVAARTELARAARIYETVRGTPDQLLRLEQMRVRVDLSSGDRGTALQRLEGLVAQIDDALDDRHAERSAYLRERRDTFLTAIESASRSGDAGLALSLADWYRAQSFKRQGDTSFAQARAEFASLIRGAAANHLVLSWTELTDQILVHAAWRGAIREMRIGLVPDALREALRDTPPGVPVAARIVEGLVPDGLLDGLFVPDVQAGAAPPVVLLLDELLWGFDLEGELRRSHSALGDAEIRRTPHLLAPDPEATSFRPSSVLSVGVGRGGDQLPPLPAAGPEARAAARLGRGSRALVDAAVTRRAIEAVISSFDVLYVAGHARQDPGSGRAAVWLPEGEGLRPWSSAQIEESGFGAPPVVVLAVCGDGAPDEGDRVGHGGGAGLARAFLRAGAHEVLTSGYSIQDRDGNHALSWLRERMSATLGGPRGSPADGSRSGWVVWVHPDRALLGW